MFGSINVSFFLSFSDSYWNSHFRLKHVCGSCLKQHPLCPFVLSRWNSVAKRVITFWFFQDVWPCERCFVRNFCVRVNKPRRRGVFCRSTCFWVWEAWQNPFECACFFRSVSVVKVASMPLYCTLASRWWLIGQVVNSSIGFWCMWNLLTSSLECDAFRIVIHMWTNDKHFELFCKWVVDDSFGYVGLNSMPSQTQDCILGYFLVSECK